MCCRRGRYEESETAGGQAGWLANTSDLKYH